MAAVYSEVRLVNGSVGDPVLFIDYPGKNDALLFDAGDLAGLSLERIADLQAVFLTHHHLDHFCSFDRILRANLSKDKTLHVFGPTKTIGRIFQRIHSYDLTYLPSMKLVLVVHELAQGTHQQAIFECAKRFPEVVPDQTTWKGPTIYDTPDLKVEAGFAEHTCPCLSYALVEKSGYHPDPAKLAVGALKPGAWVAAALEMCRAEADPETRLEIGGGQYRLGTLAEQYFACSRGARVAFITDTALTEQSQPALLKLAHRAARLYCDSYYAHAQLKQAQQHKHMTATHAAQFALQAKAEELTLIHFAPRYAGSYQALVEEARAIFPKVQAEIA